MDELHQTGPSLVQLAGKNPLAPYSELDFKDVPDWKQTFTGRGLCVSRPSPHSVSLADIAFGLAGINRYDGHTLVAESVAVHSLLVLALASYDVVQNGRELDDVSALDLLLHDAPEYVLGDVTTPTKDALNNVVPGFRAAFKTLHNAWDTVIYAKLCLGLPPCADTSDQGAYRRGVVHEYDMKALFFERALIMSNPPAPWFDETRFANVVDDYPTIVGGFGHYLNCSRPTVVGHFLDALMTFSANKPGLVEAIEEARSELDGA